METQAHNCHKNIKNLDNQIMIGENNLNADNKIAFKTQLSRELLKYFIQDSNSSRAAQEQTIQTSTTATTISPPGATKKLNCEITIDLADILFRDQFDSVQQDMSKTDNLSLDDTLSSQADDNNTQSSIEMALDTKKIKAARVAGRISKSASQNRLSFASTVSSTSSTNVGVKRLKRKLPIKLQNEDNGEEEEEDDLAKFGNKLVKKNTEEYIDRRLKNNEAVKKCRQKYSEEQKQREERLKTLTDENRKLNNTVDSLSKELSVLKAILIQMNTQSRLPFELEERIKNLEKSIAKNAKS